MRRDEMVSDKQSSYLPNRQNVPSQDSNAIYISSAVPFVLLGLRSTELQGGLPAQFGWDCATVKRRR